MVANPPLRIGNLRCPEKPVVHVVPEELTTDLIDARLLNFERFAEGRQIEETAVL